MILLVVAQRGGYDPRDAARSATCGGAARTLGIVPAGGRWRLGSVLCYTTAPARLRRLHVAVIGARLLGDCDWD